MPYWQLFYHLVWATKGRAPLLTTEIASMTHDLLRQKALALEASVFAVNGVADHVHIVVSIPPKIAISRFVGQVNASTATRINKLTQREGTLLWQEEYGALSFDRKRLPNYVAYVERQQEHHAANNLIPILERAAGQQFDPAKLRETPSPYHLVLDEWWLEMLSYNDPSSFP